MSHYFKKCIFPNLIPAIVMLIVLYISKSYIFVDNYSTLFTLALLGSITYIIVYYFISLTIAERQKLDNGIKNIYNSSIINTK